MPLPSPSQDITGLILAGGKAERMGGQDKGLLELHGAPLIEYALDVITQVTPRVIISANRHQDRYTRYGHPVVSDVLNGYAGPLAGIQAALAQIETGWLLVMPCDAPLATPDLLQRLLAGGDDGKARLARDAERLQPTFCLLHKALADSLLRFLDSGQRKTLVWLQSLDPEIADCSDHPEWFLNVNTPEELQRLAMQQGQAHG